MTTPSPAYTQAAQDAHIEGKVRVELTISATGDVTDAHVVEGLGYGLDEAALETARQYKFEPAKRCGQPVEIKIKGGTGSTVAPIAIR